MSRRSAFNLGFSFLDVLADARSNLDHRLVHLGLDPLLQDHLALFEQFGLNMRPQVPRLGIYGLIFLFNSDGESRQHKVWRGRSCPRI